jgi:hypothetical protein
MDTLYKILDVLLEALGPAAVKDHCEKQPTQEAPTEQKKVIIKKVKKSVKADAQMEDLCTSLEGLSIQKAIPKVDVNIEEITSQLAELTIQKAKEKPKAKEKRRCDARIYGEKILIDATSSPSGKPYAVYKNAQCENNASHSITDEDDGKLYLCKMCMKRYESRQEFPVIWHGFFDVDDPPATSHFINGSWHKAKVAAVC